MVCVIAHSEREWTYETMGLIRQRLPLRKAGCMLEKKMRRSLPGMTLGDSDLKIRLCQATTY